MKLILYLFLFLFGIETVVAQQTGKIDYQIESNLSFAALYPETVASLRFDGGKSYFSYFAGKPSAATIKDSVNTTFQQTVIRNGARVDDSIGRVIYLDLDANRMVARDLSANIFYIYHDSVPHIQWNILPEQKKISQFTCTKARGSLLGRTYTAWFCPDIPVSFGPWKLGGLPGLILEAQSEDGALEFMLKSLEIPAKKVEAVTPPDKGENIGDYQAFRLSIKRKSEARLKFQKARAEAIMAENPGVQMSVPILTIHRFEKD